MAANPNPLDLLLSDVQRDLPDLKGHAATAARYVVGNPRAVMALTMRELARRAEVPPVTFVRLAQRFGFKGYEGFKSVFTDQLIYQDGGNTLQARKVVDNQDSLGSAGLLEQIVRSESELLAGTLAGLPTQEIVEAAQRIAKARRVFVVGRRMAYPVAANFVYALGKARSDVYLVEDVAGGLTSRFPTDATDDDVAIAITFAPYSRLTFSVADSVFKAGGDVIALTDLSSAPICTIASWAFTAKTVGLTFPKSILGATAISTSLVALAVATLGPAALERISADEARVHSSGEYILRSV